VNALIGFPYIRAATSPSTSTYITPQLTIGSIIFNSFATTNLNMLSQTTLSYNITLEDNQNINGIVFDFASYYFIIPSNISCSINNINLPCSSLSNNSLVIFVSTILPKNILIEINNIINYISVGNWTVTSVQITSQNSALDYSNVDLYSSNGLNLHPFVTSPLYARLIIPKNYAQPTPMSFIIIIDSLIPIQIPTNLLKVNFTSSNACSSTQPYSKTITITCTFSTSQLITSQITLYHSAYSSIPLSRTSS
jgi:hypothetical protein